MLFEGPNERRLRIPRLRFGFVRLGDQLGPRDDRAGLQRESLRPGGGRGVSLILFVLFQIRDSPHDLIPRKRRALPVRRPGQPVLLRFFFAMEDNFQTLPLGLGHHGLESPLTNESIQFGAESIRINRFDLQVSGSNGLVGLLGLDFLICHTLSVSFCCLCFFHSLYLGPQIGGSPLGLHNGPCLRNSLLGQHSLVRSHIRNVPRLIQLLCDLHRRLRT